MLKNTLEIILITYNRKPYLEKTFKRLLAEDSPVKDLQITVLDNCSSDGTSEYLSDLSKKYKNIKHIRHNRNIGANANIARAFEIATKPYLWILADDDDFDFTDFNQVQEALLNENPALLIVALRESEIICAKEGMANEYTGDNSVLKAELPYFKFTSYADGIKKFYNYLKERTNAEQNPA